MPLMLRKEQDSRRAARLLLKTAATFREYREAELEAEALALCWHHACRHLYWPEPRSLLSVVPERGGFPIPGVRFSVRDGDQARLVMLLLREAEVGDAGRVESQGKVLMQRTWFLWRPDSLPVLPEAEPVIGTMYKTCTDCGRPAMPHSPLDYICTDCRRRKDHSAALNEPRVPSNRFGKKPRVTAP